MQMTTDPRAEADGNKGRATAIAQARAQAVVPVLFGRRLGAFAIDTLLVGILLIFVHGFLETALQPLMVDMATTSDLYEFAWAMPWGYHDPALPLALQAIIVVASAVTVLGYFTWFEADQGHTPGKRALELRVVRIDGRPMTYRESFIRNFAKAVPPLLLLDMLIMLIASGADKQRVSDTIAETIVVRA